MVKLLVAVTLTEGFQLRKLQFFHRATGHVSDESSEVQVGAPDSAPSFDGLPIVCCMMGGLLKLYQET